MVGRGHGRFLIVDLPASSGFEDGQTTRFPTAYRREPSSPAKAGDVVRRDLSINHERLWKSAREREGPTTATLPTKSASLTA
jgi:hypothetical protein